MASLQAGGGAWGFDVSVFSVHYLSGIVLFFLLAKNLSLYDLDIRASLERATARIIKVTLFWAFMFLGGSMLLGLQPPVSRLFVVCSCAMICVFLPLWRYLYIKGVCCFGFDQNSIRRFAIIGNSPEGDRFAERLAHGEAEFNSVVGIVATHGGDDGRPLSSSVIGMVSELEDVLDRHEVDSVAVVDAELSNAEVLRIAKICERRFVEFNLVPGYFEIFTSCLAMKRIAGLSLVGVVELPQNRIFSQMAKRLVDIFGALIGLILTLSILPIVIFFIWRESPGPVVFKQIRAGEGGRLFTIYKFRSMKLNSESDGKARWCTRDDPRRLKAGAFMRKWNIDELPQFWNVLKGDMSLVGPRPERPELIKEFLDKIPHYQSRHSVKPGMTGWAQVNGLRGDTSLVERVRYDLYYIENWSIWMDFIIQIRTIFCYKNAH